MLRTAYRIIFGLTTGFLAFFIASPIFESGLSLSLIDDLLVVVVWFVGVVLMLRSKNSQLGLFLTSAPILFILISAIFG